MCGTVGRLRVSHARLMYLEEDEEPTPAPVPTNPIDVN